MPVAIVSNLRELPGYTSAGFALMGLMNKAPHPNAAKLFINWIASREGMEFFCKKANLLPVRTDIDKSSFPAYLIPEPGQDYMDSYDYDFAVNQRLPIGDKIRAMLR